MIDINIYQGKVCINSPNEVMQENNHTKEEKKHEVGLKNNGISIRYVYRFREVIHAFMGKLRWRK
jgi:hypothetical protein